MKFAEICSSEPPAAPICSIKCIENHENPTLNAHNFLHKQHFTDSPLPL